MDGEPAKPGSPRTPLRRLARVLRAIGLALASVVLVALLAVLLALGLACYTDSGRARVLAFALQAADDALPGRITARALVRLELTGVGLRGVEIYDPSGERVLALERLDVELAPGAWPVLRVSSLGLHGLRVELADLGAQRGLLAAVVPPAAEAEPAARTTPPEIAIERIELSDVQVRAELPELGALELNGLAARGRFALVAGAAQGRLDSLRVELLRDRRSLVRIETLAGELDARGGPARVELGARIGDSALRVALRARSAGPWTADSAQRAALEAEVALDRLDASLLRALGQEPLAAQWPAPARIELQASGTARALTSRVRVVSDPVQLELNATLRDYHDAQVSLSARAYGGTLALQATGELAEPGQRARGTVKLALPSLRGLPAAWRAQIAGAASDPQPDGALALDARFDVSRSALDVQGRVSADRLALAAASLHSLRAEISARGPLAEPVIDLGLRLRGARQGEHTVERAELRLRGGPRRYRLSASGQGSDGRVELNATLDRSERDVVVAMRAAGRARGHALALGVERARIGYDGSASVRGLHVDALGQRVELAGELTASRQLRGVELRARKLDLGLLARGLALPVALGGEADLAVQLNGALDAPELALELNGRAVGLADEPRVDLQLKGTLDVPGRALSLEAGVQSSAARSGGELRSAGAGLALQATLRSELAAASGRAAQPWPERVQLGQHQLELTLVRVDSEWLSGLLSEPLPVRAASRGQLRATGTLAAPELALALETRVEQPPEAREPPLETALRVRYAAGSVEATLDAGTSAGPWLHAEAALREASGLQAWLAAPAALLATAHWQARVDVRPAPLAQLPLPQLKRDRMLGALSPELSLQAEHAAGAEPRANLVLVLRSPEQVSPVPACGQRLPALELRARADLHDGRLDANAQLLREQDALLQLNAKLELALQAALAGRAPLRAGALDLALDLAQLDVAVLPVLCETARGRISGRVRGRDLLGAAPELQLTLAGSQLSAGAAQGLGLSVRASASATRAEVSIAIDGAAAGGTRARSQLNGSLPIAWSGAGDVRVAEDAPLRARAELHALPLAPLLPLAGPLSRVSGTLDGHVELTGTLGEPRWRGELRPQNLAFTATALAQPLHEVTGRLRFVDARLELDGLRAHDEDGTLTRSGHVELDRARELRAVLTLDADEFPIRQQGQVAGTLDAHIAVRAHAGERRTDVNVILREASAWLRGGELRRGIELEAHPDIVDPRAASAPSEAPAAPDAQNDQHDSGPPLLLTLDADDAFWVRRDDFAVELSTRLRVRVEHGAVTAQGRLALRRGYLQLLGQTFEIDADSRVELTGSTPPDPTLDIGARTENRHTGKVTRVHIGGRASSPQLTFYVDDAETTAGGAAEALFGKERGAEQRDAGGQARSFVAGMMAGVMAMSTRRELGDAMPILLLEPGQDVSSSRVRAGFELDKLVPGFLESVVRGVYVEGILAGPEGGGARNQVGTGVLLELYFPHDLLTSGQYGPGEVWSVDVAWEP